MAKVESFTLDHTAVKAPYVRLITVETGAKGDKISNFDLRFVQPNEKQGIQNTDRGHAGGKRFARAFNAAQSKRIGPPHA